MVEGRNRDAACAVSSEADPMEPISSAARFPDAEPGRVSVVVLQDEAHYFDGRQFCSQANFGMWVNWLAGHLGKTTLSVPTARSGPPFGRPLDLPNVTLTALPYWRSILTYLKLNRADKKRFRKTASELVAQHDAVMVRVPSWAATVFAREANRQNKTFITYLAANILTCPNPLRSPNPLTRLAAKCAARYVHHSTLRMVAQADLALCVGGELYRYCEGRAGKAVQVMESLLAARELYEREDSFTGDGPVIMFRAARIDRNKGTEYLIDAMAILVRRGYDLRLKLAGEGDGVYIDRLCKRATDQGIGERIDWLGQIEFGPDLFYLYRESHLGVLSSLSEGFPRFIGEAWGFSLPVVTTRLPGLVPTVVPDENAVLAEPASAESLAEAIRRVIDDRALRVRIIKGGLAVARSNTAETQSKWLAGLIAETVARRSDR